jgi:hypothetical protein
VPRLVVGEVPGGGQEEAIMPNDTNIDLSLESEDPEIIRKMLEEAGARNVSQVSERGLTGVEITLLAIMAIQALANLIIRLSPLLKSGIIVDVRGSKVRIRKDKALPRGDVLVITKKGEKSTLHQPSEAKISTLLQLGKAS